MRVPVSVAVCSMCSELSWYFFVTDSMVVEMPFFSVCAVCVRVETSDFEASS